MLVLTPELRQTIVEQATKWSRLQRREFVDSERLIEWSFRGPSISIFAPKVGEPVTVMTVVDENGTVSIRCDCPTFAAEGICPHVATIALEYYDWCFKGG